MASIEKLESRKRSSITINFHNYGEYTIRIAKILAKK